MSVSHTEAAVVARTKTVTRRLGWLFLKPGDRVTLCRTVMGRKAGEPLVRLAEVEIVSVRRERLREMTQADMSREGVAPDHIRPGGWVYGPTVNDWIHWFATTMGCSISDEVTRIEWRYL